MPETCEFLDECGFFLNFKSNSEVLKQGWVRMFCENKKNLKMRAENSQKRERKAAGRQHGPDR